MKKSSHEACKSVFQQPEADFAPFLRKLSSLSVSLTAEPTCGHLTPMGFSFVSTGNANESALCCGLGGDVTALLSQLKHASTPGGRKYFYSPHSNSCHWADISERTPRLKPPHRDEQMERTSAAERRSHPGLVRTHVRSMSLSQKL